MRSLAPLMLGLAACSVEPDQPITAPVLEGYARETIQSLLRPGVHEPAELGLDGPVLYESPIVVDALPTQATLRPLDDGYQIALLLADFGKEPTLFAYGKGSNPQLMAELDLRLQAEITDGPSPYANDKVRLYGTLLGNGCFTFERIEVDGKPFVINDGVVPRTK